MRLTKLLRLIARKTGATVNIETVHPAFLAAERLKLDPDQHVHSGDHCRQMKLDGNFKICSANKRRSIRIAEKGRPFCGTCPNGVWELAWPVIHGGQLAAVIYLGHFATGKSPSTGQGRKIPASGQAPESGKRHELYRWASFAAQFIRTELELLTFEQPELFKRRTESDFASQCISFIDQRYAKDVSLTDLAGLLGTNPNYLSGRIHRATGRTFRTLLNEKRIREAQTYLRLHRKLSVTEIAGICGFSNSNYFSTVFRRITKLTPMEYRWK